jgi:hypothetical protein
MPVQLSLVDMIVKGVVFGFIEPMVQQKLGVEPSYGIEPLLLKCVIQGLPEIEVLQFPRSGRSGPCPRRCEYENCQ